MLLTRILSIIFPIFAIVTVGYAYGRWRRVDMSMVNTLNMDVLVPALLFFVLSSRSFDLARYSDLALGAAAVVIGSGVLALGVAWLARIQAKTLVPPMMFTNTGNMGLPLAVFAFGEQALPAAVMLLIITNGLHFTLGTFLMDHRAALLGVIRKPIVAATLLGLGFNLLGWTLPGPVSVTMEMLGQASIPLLLFSLGVRLTEVDLRDWKIGALGAVLCPSTGIVLVLMLRPLFDLTPLQSGLFLVFGALPPAVLNFLVAEQFNQEPKNVASIVLLGNLAATVSIPLALFFAIK